MILRWVLAFLVLALVSAIFGYAGIADTFAWLGKVLFMLFVILFLLSVFSPKVRKP